MKSTTTAISIHLPIKLAKSSQKIATLLHISRSEFIRMAIEHEIRNWQVQQEQIAMAKAFEAMVKDKAYLQESEEIFEGLDTPTDDEDEGEWWKK